eukprot:6203443-Pleurochrysis_carterae.AAC.2
MRCSHAGGTKLPCHGRRVASQGTAAFRANRPARLVLACLQDALRPPHVVPDDDEQRVKYEEADRCRDGKALQPACDTERCVSTLTICGSCGPTCVPHAGSVRRRSAKRRVDRASTVIVQMHLSRAGKWNGLPSGRSVAPFSELRTSKSWDECRAFHLFMLWTSGAHQRRAPYRSPRTLPTRRRGHQSGSTNEKLVKENRPPGHAARTTPVRPRKLITARAHRTRHA